VLARPELSVVVPVYGCADCLTPLHNRLRAVLDEMGLDYELVYVDDRSPDSAWLRLTELGASDSTVRAIRLSRNFGQHAAITAGLAEARGRVVAVMDCDLQDPPESLPALWQKIEAGFDIVLARRLNRQQTRARRAAARLYFLMLRAFTGSKLDGDYGTLSMITRKVVDAYLLLGDQRRHYLFVVQWLGFERTEIEVEHGERVGGSTSYSFSALVLHAFEGIFFQTTRLLRWIVYLGFAVALGGVALAAFLVVNRATSSPYPGWTSLAVLVLLMGGAIIVCIGVAGLYIEQIFNQVKGRPLFLIDERVGVGIDAEATVSSAREARV
jgi:glycosyltransferase involved in cell wall biosynthesis